MIKSLPAGGWVGGDIQLNPVRGGLAGRAVTGILISFFVIPIDRERDPGIPGNRTFSISLHRTRDPGSGRSGSKNLSNKS